MVFFIPGAYAQVRPIKARILKCDKELRAHKIDADGSRRMNMRGSRIVPFFPVPGRSSVLPSAQIDDRRIHADRFAD